MRLNHVDATIPSRRLRRAALVLSVAAMAMGAPASLAPAFAEARPNNLADLVDTVDEAVVNI